MFIISTHIGIVSPKYLQKFKISRKLDRPKTHCISTVWHHLFVSSTASPAIIMLPELLLETRKCHNANNRKFTLLWLAGYEQLAKFDEYERSWFLENLWLLPAWYPDEFSKLLLLLCLVPIWRGVECKFVNLSV